MYLMVNQKVWCDKFDASITFYGMLCPLMPPFWFDCIRHTHCRIQLFTMIYRDIVTHLQGLCKKIEHLEFCNSLQQCSNTKLYIYVFKKKIMKHYITDGHTFAVVSEVFYHSKHDQTCVIFSPNMHWWNKSCSQTLTALFEYYRLIYQWLYLQSYKIHPAWLFNTN